MSQLDSAQQIMWYKASEVQGVYTESKEDGGCYNQLSFLLGDCQKVNRPPCKSVILNGKFPDINLLCSHLQNGSDLITSSIEMWMWDRYRN